ncbi:MAG TPA: hypothetical protein VFT72_11035 [Opitutaceae bacterium]|nr:hypothetical protein [Opitutaceae bacterium]
MKYRSALILALLVSLVSPRVWAAETNCVVHWNNEVLNATRLSRNPPPLAAVFFAAYHAAIFDTVNGINRKYHGWLVDEPAPAGANCEAAVASAAHTVLLAYWSQSTNPHNLDVAYEKALASIPDGKAKTDGIAWGKKVAEAVIKNRADSGYNKPIPGQYTSNEPGKWRETPVGFRPPTLPFFGAVKPFVMTSNDQFRAPPPYKMDSDEAAAELAYVAKVGARDGAERTEYETLSTPFWSDDLGTATPPGHWNVVAQDLATQKKLDELETARLFALLNFAEADAGISCWETKFFYRTWRPETALREQDPKVNPKFTPQPDFIPNMPSPSFPSYTSGHSTFSAAATRILERFFGTDDIEFSVKSDGLPGAVRTFKKLSDARREVGMSRVMGGIHTMADNLEGQKTGIKIADWTFDNAIKPL